MDEPVPTKSDVASNNPSEHRTEKESTHLKSPHDLQNQLVSVNKSAQGPTEHEETLDKEHSAQEYQNMQHEKMQEQQQSQSDLSSELKFLDWDALQRKFNSTMQDQDEEEKKIIERFDKLVTVRKLFTPSAL